MATLNNNNSPFINELLLGKISRVNTTLKQTIHASLSKFNLSVEQFTLLQILHKLPENKCTLLKMLDMDFMDSAHLLKSIKHLESAGLAKKKTLKPSEDTEVRLTPKGLKTLSSITNYKEFMDSSLEGLNNTEKKLLYTLLGKVQSPIVFDIL